MYVEDFLRPQLLVLWVHTICVNILTCVNRDVTSKVCHMCFGDEMEILSNQHLATIFVGTVWISFCIRQPPYDSSKWKRTSKKDEKNNWKMCVNTYHWNAQYFFIQTYISDFLFTSKIIGYSQTFVSIWMCSLIGIEFSNFNSTSDTCSLFLKNSRQTYTLLF